MTIRSTQSQKSSRHAVTLIELLIVIGLIGMMAGMAAHVYRGAQDDAKVARTRSIIAKLSDVVLSQWEEYRYRAVDVRMDSFPGPTDASQLRMSRIQAHMRMLVLRDTMRMEMPDRVTDLLFAPSQYVVSADIDPNNVDKYLRDRAYPHKFGNLYSALYRSVLASTNVDIKKMREDYPIVYPNSVASGGVESAVGEPRSFLISGNSDEALRAWSKQIQSSELLYLIVANSTYGGTPALEHFRPSEIGDRDEDGLLEFIDAWGNPIHWIRWPAGYPSDLNRYAGTDAMDPLRTDWRYSDTSGNFTDANRPQTIVPLIVSGGPDAQFGITFGFGPDQENPIPIVYATMHQSGNNSRYYVDPFFTYDGQGNINPSPPQPPNASRTNQLGSVPPNEFYSDNITNHEIILGL